VFKVANVEQRGSVAFAVVEGNTISDVTSHEARQAALQAVMEQTTLEEPAWDPSGSYSFDSTKQVYVRRYRFIGR